jgi:hypothetical protein
VHVWHGVRRRADEIEATVVSGDIADGFRLGTKDDLRKRYDVAYGLLNERSPLH